MANPDGPISQSERRESEPTRLRLFSPAAIEKWWVEIPARLNRYSSLLSAAWSDGMYLTAWPRVAMLLPLLSLILGLVEGASHWSVLTIGENYVSASVPVVAFAQILPLVILAAVVGSLSANAGLMLVLGYALGDYLWAGPQIAFNPGPWLPSFLFTRTPMLLSYLLFSMLAVVPIVSTKHLLADLYDRMPGRDVVSTIVRVAATAVVQGLFVYAWIFIAPMVMRTLWVWPTHTYYGAPVAIGYFRQILSPWLEIAAIAAVLVRSWLMSRAERDPAVETRIQKLNTAVEGGEKAPLFYQRLPWLRVLLSALLMMLLISGFIDSIWLGAVMMAVFAAPLLAREYLLKRSILWTRWTGLVTRVPQVIRIAAAALATFLMTLAELAVFPGQAPARNSVPGAFGAELVSLSFGLIVLVALVPAHGGSEIQSYRTEGYEALQARGTWATALMVFLVALFMLFTTRTVYASCRDPYCCCAGDSTLCALGAAGFPPFWAPFVGTLPRKRKKKRDPCAPIRQHLGTLELQLQDLLFQRQLYEQQTQDAIQGLYDRINQIDEEQNALSADISRSRHTLYIDELRLKGDEDLALEYRGDDAADEHSGVVGAAMGNQVDMFRLESEIPALKQQIADDETKEASLQSEQEQDNQQIDALEYEMSNKLEEFDRQAADLRRQIEQTRKRLEACEKAARQAPAVPA